MLAGQIPEAVRGRAETKACRGNEERPLSYQGAVKEWVVFYVAGSASMDLTPLPQDPTTS